MPNVIMRDLPIPGWRLHIIRSKLGCQNKKKPNFMHTYRDGVWTWWKQRKRYMLG
jgi:hypothetical protein